MALKTDLQALLTVSDKIKADVSKLDELKALLIAVDTKGDTFDIYWRGVNDTEYRYTISKTALKTLIESESVSIDNNLKAQEASTLLEAEISKLGGK